MNVLVLGAGGYTGRHLVETLLARKDNVRGLVRQVEQGIPLEKMGMELRVGDIRDPASLRDIAADCQVIFNLISSCRVEPSESQVILLDAARNIFRNVDRGALKKYIWCSNVSVYGFPKATERLTETSRLNPAYGLGKITVDAENLAQESVPAIAVRVANIYGPGRDQIAALRENRLRLLNGGENWTSRIHVADLVTALIAAMERARAESVFLAVDDLPVKQIDFFAELAAATGSRLPLNLETNAARAYGLFGRAMNSLAGERQYQLSENVIGLLTGNYFCVNDKLKQELGVVLQYPTFREGYKEILSRG
jgi:nucleoside-diphosphate-sugar epimerase